ncbi:right-handed parallel beta-helix repeat-containing protein [Epibacterium sp. DP7N7-1]|nr:right-handed parallel beta-helix repeat-containing protein [Epibacterium sp. DP7N7-1]
MTLRLTALSGLSFLLTSTALFATNLQLYHEEGLSTGIALSFPFAIEENRATIARLSYGRDEDHNAQLSIEAMRRMTLAHGWTVGVGVFADSSTDDIGNRFSQVGMSGDLQRGIFQANLNAYLPVGTKSHADARHDALAEMDGTIRFKGGRSLALRGLDAEMGARFAFSALGGGSFGLFGGGFTFEHSDGASYDGTSARAEWELENLFGTYPGALVRAGVRAERAAGRTDSSAYVSLSIPLGAKPTKTKGENGRPRASSLNRLTRDTLRRRRVTTRAGAYGAAEAVTLSGQALGGFTRASEGDNLQDALNTTGANGLVFASGSFTTAGLTLANGQTLVGGGGAVTLQAANGRQMVLANSGAATTIQGQTATSGSAEATNTEPVSAILTMANDSTARHLTLTGGVQGIAAHGADNVTVSDIHISDTLDDAVHLTDVSNASFSKISIDNAGGNGFAATGGSNIAINSASIAAPGENGFELRNIDGFSLQNAHLSDMAICEDNTLCEFSVYNPNSVPNSGVNAIGLTNASFDNIRMDDVTYGFFLASEISTADYDYTITRASTDLSLNDITITNSRREAILAVGVDGLDMTHVTLDNSAQDRDMDLVVIQSSGRVTMENATLSGGINGLMLVDALRLESITEDMRFRNITISDTSRAGIFLNPIRNVNFENTTVSNAGTHGIFMLGDSWGYNGGPITDVEFTDVTIDNAATAGVNFYGPATNVSGNVTVLNTPADCSADTGSWSGTALDNDASHTLTINGMVMGTDTLADCASPY